MPCLATPNAYATKSGLRSNLPSHHLTTMWEIFNRKPQTKQLVTKGRFEMERDGELGFLEYTLSGHVLTLLHSEVPEKLRHHGVGFALAEHALKWARENHMKVDIVCPIVEEYIDKHPEYSDLVLR